MILVHAFVFPTPAGAPRYVRTVSLPVGAQVLGVYAPPGDGPRLIVRGDTAAAVADSTFSLVRADVPLAAAEQTAPYVGTIPGYAGVDGTPLYYLLGPA